jgi:hypothetical protein
MAEIKLSDSFTIFFHTFHYKHDFPGTILSDYFWTESDVRPDYNFLLNHIHDFFKDTSADKDLDKNGTSIKIFEIISDDLDTDKREKLLLYNSLFKRTHHVFLNDESVNFSICQERSILSPKLIILPLTNVGFLTFGIKLATDSATLKKVQELNYRLRNFSQRHTTEIHTKRKTHPRAYEQEQKIKDCLNDLSDTSANDTSFIWNINSWIEYLLNGLVNQDDTFTANYLQAFTYVNLIDKIGDQQLRTELFRLGQIYSSQVIPNDKILESRKNINQVFSKIHYITSIEGAAIAVQTDDSPFLKNYAQTVLNRSSWVFFIAYLQRIALLDGIQKAVTLVRSGLDVEKLQKQIIEIKKILFHFDFRELSYNTYQNEYYRFCIENLHIEDLADELQKKLNFIRNEVINQMKEDESKNSKDIYVADQNKKKKKGLFG